MNRKGQGGLAIISAIVIFIIGMTTINIIKPEVTTAVAPDALDCNNVTGITDGNKMTCLAVDIVVPYFILIIVSVSGGLLINTFIGGKK